MGNEEYWKWEFSKKINIKLEKVDENVDKWKKR